MKNIRKKHGPKELPILGSAHRFGRDPLKFMDDLYRDFGPTAEYTLFGQPFIAVFSPSHVEQILTKNSARYRKGEFIRERWKDLFGEGVVTAHGEKWKNERRAMLPFMSNQRVSTYFDIMLDLSKKYVDSHPEKSILDLKKDMTDLMLFFLIKILFRSDLDDAVIKRFGILFDICIDYFNYTLQPSGILFKNFNTPQKKKYLAAITELDSLIEDLAKKTDPAETNFLSSLTHTLDEGGKPLSAKIIRDNLLSFFIAGHETSSLTICYTLFLLSTHPHETLYVQEQIDEVLKGRLPTYEDLEKLTRVRNILNESMRLYTPVPLIGREAVEDDELDGLKISKGTNIMISAHTIHRNPKYFENPSDFLPRRWESLDPIAKRNEFMPFGTGPRVCMGANLAMMEMVTFLTVILQKNDFKLVSSPKLKLMVSLTLRPLNDILIEVTPRKS